MNYYLHDGTRVTLSQQEFIAQGGEGRIFGRGDRAFKIYRDPKRVIPLAKVRELSRLTAPNILKPRELVFDRHRAPAGIVMDRARDTLPLCRLFTTDFRRQHGVDTVSTLALVERIRATIASIHRAGCLMVDGNEFNYLVSESDLQTPWFIDVDSYRTPSFPATAVMATIFDPHSPAFTTGTDWFAFAVVACQLFVGIHPYKGRHPDYPRNDLTGRMRDNVSIFHPGIALPPAVRDPNRIPAAWRDWFVALFEKGVRCPPPDVAAVGAVTAPPPVPAAPAASVPGGSRLEIRRLQRFDEPVIGHAYRLGVRLVRTPGHLYLDRRRVPAPHGSLAILSPQRRLPVLARARDGRLEITSPGGPAVDCPPMKADSLTAAGNSLHVHRRGMLTRLAVSDAGSRLIVSVADRRPVMPNATELFDGVVFQSMLGKTFLAFPLGGDPDRCPLVPVPELAPYRLVHARHAGGVCMLVGYAAGRYDRLELKFDRDYRSYACRFVEGVEPAAPDFAVLDNGLVACVVSEGRLEIFHRRPDRPEIRRIADPRIDAAMRLCREGDRLLFYKDRELCHMTLSGSAPARR